MAWLDRWRRYVSSTQRNSWPQTVNTSPTMICRPAQSAGALPRNLKRLRTAYGWTINQLAVASHVSDSTIRGIERGDGAHAVPDPLLTTALKLARALNVGVEALVEEGHGESL